MSVLIVRTHFYINGCIPVLSVELSLLCLARMYSCIRYHQQKLEISYRYLYQCFRCKAKIFDEHPGHLSTKTITVNTIMLDYCQIT